MTQISLVKLAEIVKLRRETLHYTQDRLSLKTGINRNMIGRIETMKYIPSIPQLQALMGVLNFNYDHIKEEKDNSDVFVAMMGQAKTEEEKKCFEDMIQMILVLQKYRNLRRSYNV